MSQGRKEDPEPMMFLPAVEVYGHIPKEHFYEELSRLLDLSFIYDLTKPLYAERIGRPSLDPVVFFKCMLVAFFENIVYDTELEFRLADSLLLRRFIGYGLDERTPDESTLRKTRKKMPEEAFQRVFEHVLDVCQKHGLLQGRAIGTDSTLVDANASMDSLHHKELGCTYEEFMLALRRQDDPDASKGEAIRADRDRKGKGSNTDWVSSTDSEAKVMQHPDGHTHLSYKANASVDLETGIVVQAGAEQANLSDQADFLGRVDEATAALEERGLSPAVVVADKGHHCGENLAGLDERGVVGLISSPNGNRGAPGFRREDFFYDEEREFLVCPAGQMLIRLSNSDKTHRYYKGKGKVCKKCPHFGVCTRSPRGRVVSISVHEDRVRANRELVRSEEMRPLMQIRRQRGEAPFGYFKQFGGLRRLSGRGLEFAGKKVLMAAAGWNLLLLVKALMHGSTLGTAVCVLIGLIMALLAAFRRLQEAILKVGARISVAGNESLARRATLPTFAGKPCLSGGC